MPTEVKYAETNLSTLVEVGRRAKLDERQFVLMKLVDYLSHKNSLVRHTAITSIHRLARSSNDTPWTLFSPYLRHISIHVLRRSASQPQLIAVFANLVGKTVFCDSLTFLGISTMTFLARTEAYIIPTLVLLGRQDLFQRIVVASNHESSQKLLYDNIAPIMAQLLTSGSDKDQLIRYLSHMEPKFSGLNVDEIIRSVPIPLCSELLQMFADESIKRTTILAALSSVAYISMKPSSSTRKTPKDVAQDTLRAFLEKHSLGIVGLFSEHVNGYRGKCGTPDKIRYITAIGELIMILGRFVEHAVPQITACLQSAVEEPELRFAAISSWDSLGCASPESILGTLLPHSACLFLNIWEQCHEVEKSMMINVMDNFIEEHEEAVQRAIGQVPLMRLPGLEDIEEKLSKFRRPMSLPVQLRALNVLIATDNPAMCEEGLKELKIALIARENEVHSSLLREQSDPAIGETLRCLLDIASKAQSVRKSTQILVADCLGLFGAPDPVRQSASKKTTREVILHNFGDTDAEESVKFVRILLETQLVDAFRSATNSNVQIFLAWAIQELLKFSGLNDSVLGNADDRNGKVVDIEARKRWRSFSQAARDTMTPLLRSRWDLPSRSSIRQVSYPIIDYSRNYREWLFNFLFDLLQSGVGENARKLFNVFARILRQDEVVVSNFLLPYVFLNVCTGCSEDKRALLLLELITILRRDDTGSDAVASEFTRLARESVFSILDYLSHWSRSRRIFNRDRLAEKMKRQNRQLYPEDEYDEDQSVKQIQRFMAEIPAKLMSQAALACGSYSRALFYWEQFIRTEETPEKAGLPEIEQLYAHLQHLYININDPDGIEGVATKLHDLTLDQEILMHENAGRWTAAQSSYELALQRRPDDNALRRGLLFSLKQSGHHELLLDQACAFLSQSSTDNRPITDLALESSWYLGRWEKTAELLQSCKQASYSVLLAKALLCLKEARSDAFFEKITELKDRAMQELASSNLDSTSQCYEPLVKLSIVHELDSILLRSDTKSSKLNASSVLQTRIAIMPATSPWKQHILALRRTVIALRNPSNKRSMCSIWLQSAKLARKAKQPQQSYKAILHALDLKGLPLSQIEHARWWWKEGHQMRAIQILKKSLETKVFDDYLPDPNEPILSIDLSLSLTGKQPKAALISKAELLLTRWNDLAENANSKQQLREYSTASRGSQLEKPHYFMGRYYLRLLESEAKKSPEHQDPDFIMGEYHRQVVMSYGRAMHFGVKYIFQTLPSYLQLWLDFGEQVKLVHPKAGNGQKRQELAHSRLSHLANMNEKIKGFITRLPTYLYMLALPQILSRINHSEKNCYTLLETMISKCLNDYPKQSLWPFMAVCKSRDTTRSSRGHTLIAKLRSEAKGSENLVLLKLTNDAQNLTDQLMHLCTVPVIKNRSSLSLTRDLEFNARCAPSNLVVPIQANLTVILPAQGGVGSTKHHRAFEDSQPTISDFIDEVDVMSSLQKPRKITIRASDGQLYPFLVKPNDDLRKDARLMDFNGVVQKFIRRDPEALARTMKIRTYSVIALNEDHGLCEWVRNTRPFRDIVIKTYSARGIPMNYSEVKNRLENCLSSQNPGLAFERHILKAYPPTFHDWFVEKFADPSNWFAARLSYSRTLAVMSMVGFVLGLGDRHGENILFDETTGDAVHVDFNCLFEKGHTFDKPERVPFRLTHNFVNALGVTGVEGSYRKTCEITLRILRQNQDAFNTVLESFLHDPVGEFLKKVKKSATGDFEKEEAKKVLSVIASKLSGSAGSGIADKHIPLSVEGQAEELIKQATDNKLLVQMYIGWTSWL